MDVSLDNEQIALIAGKQITMIPYPDICLYNNIEDLFATNYVLLNYLTSSNYGHWVGLHKKGNVITFFDSYGKLPDDQLDYIPLKYRVESNQDFPYLVNLMLKWCEEKKGRSIHYNDEQFQRYSSKINTCGRWVGFYLRYSDDYTVEEFEKILEEVRDECVKELCLKGIDRDLFFDRLIVILTDVYLTNP